MIQTWQCPDCKRHATGNITKCRNCGRVKPTYGIVDPEAKPERKAKRSKANKPCKYCNSTGDHHMGCERPRRKNRDPHISDDPEIYYVSTLLMADGRTVEDLQNEEK